MAIPFFRRVLLASVVCVVVWSPLDTLAQDPPKIQRFLQGVDASTTPMDAAEIAKLNDPWALSVLRKDVFPKDLMTALSALDSTYSEQQSFFVSESGLLPIAATVVREFRTVVTRAKPNTSLPEILISAPAGSREGFVELMSWDPMKKAFNFYRRPKGSDWVWRGDSRDAFRRATAGKGCFECHVHGAPIMKEMRSPWNNWHSQSASIPPEAIPSKEIRESPLFKNKLSAEVLEPIIRGWESQTANEQVRSQMQLTMIEDAQLLLRPLFVTDTVNLHTSLQRSNGVPPVDFPSRFFLNYDFFSIIVKLKPSQFKTDRKLYAQSLRDFDFKLSDGARFTQAGDTHFAFLVPIPAESGTALVKQMLTQRVVTDHFALSVQLVDFPNPVYSPMRASLWKYVPTTAAVKDGISDLADTSARAIIAAAPCTPPNSSERQFVDHWKKAAADLRADATKRIQDYQAALLPRLQTQVGVNDFTRLAESRRRRFAASALNEFPLLLPRTNLEPNLDMRMNADGSVSRN
jgi:hypothetical protein